MAGNTKNELALTEAALKEADAASADATLLAKQAEDALAALEDGIREGDDSITPEDLDKGRSLVKFATLRREAAQRRAATAAQAKEAATINAAVVSAVKAARDLLGNAPNLDALEDSAVKAIQAYFSAATSMHTEIRSVVTAINNATERAVELGLATPAEQGVCIDPNSLWITRGSADRVPVHLADYTSRKAVRRLLERTGIAEFTIGGDARLTPEMREISLPNNAERF